MKILNNSSFLAALVLGPAVLVSSIGWGQTVDYFTDNGFANPLSTLQHPTAAYYKGTTYIAYQGPHMDAYVCAYNHASGKWSGPVLAGVSLMAKVSEPADLSEADSHGKPALIVDNRGYLHVVYGAHGGTPELGDNSFGTPGSGKMIHVVSKHPEDISSWEVLDNIPHFGTYTQFVKMDDGTIYLFYRHGSHRSDWVYQKSSDNGRTFSREVSILKHKVQESDPRVHDAWYAWFAKGRGDTIAAVYVYHPCIDAPNHSGGRFNAYYMKMNCADGSWENAAGERLTVSVTKEQADKKTLVDNSGILGTNRGGVRVDSEGNPHVFFRYNRGQVRYSQWTGSAWTSLTAVLPGDGGGDGDMIVDSPGTTRMILTSRDSNTPQVGWWKTTDGGLTWAKGPTLLTAPGAAGDGLEIGTLIQDYTAEGMIIVSERVSQTTLYRKMILLGMNGPVRRPAAEASQIKGLLNSGDDSTDVWSAKAKKRAEKKASEPPQPAATPIR